MSLHLCASVPLLSFTRLPAKSRTCISLETNGSENSAPRPVKRMAANRNSDSTIIRRNANYQRPIWDYDYMQSLRSEYLVGYHAHFAKGRNGKEINNHNVVKQ
jgi:(-)-alpha-terpineol synthase